MRLSRLRSPECCAWMGRKHHCDGYHNRLDTLAHSERLSSDASSLEARLLMLLLLRPLIQSTTLSVVILTSTLY